MKNNKKGFSLIIAMGIVIIISLLAYTMLVYIIPFGRDVKGIENSSNSYYLANSGIEEGLYHIKIRNDKKEEESKDFFGQISYMYKTYSSGTVLPPAGEGNSHYDYETPMESWNIISQGNPLQLNIGYGYIGDLDDFRIAFRVPNLDLYSVNSNVETITGSVTVPYHNLINWQLTSLNNTLNASGGIITNNDILDSDKEYSDGAIDLKDLDGTDLNGDNFTIGEFYGDYCEGSGSGCILKFSIVNKLELDIDNVGVPYLEWRMDIDSDNDGNNNIPLRYTKIITAGKSMGFKKELDIKIVTKTLNQAFDFTVFQ